MYTAVTVAPVMYRLLFQCGLHVTVVLDHKNGGSESLPLRVTSAATVGVSVNGCTQSQAY